MVARGAKAALAVVLCAAMIMSASAGFVFTRSNTTTANSQSSGAGRETETARAEGWRGAKLGYCSHNSIAFLGIHLPHRDAGTGSM